MTAVSRIRARFSDLRWSALGFKSRFRVHQIVIVKRSRSDAMKTFLNDETGLELSEYAVASALVAITVVVTFQSLGDAIISRIEELTSRVNG